MGKGHQISYSRESLKINDDRVSNFSETSEDDSEYIINPKSCNLSQITEKNSEVGEESEYIKKLHFSPSLPTKVNSTSNLQKGQKTFLVRNQYETSKYLDEIKQTIEDTIRKYSDKIQEEINELNKNYQNNYEGIYIIL